MSREVDGGRERNYRGSMGDGSKRKLLRRLVRVVLIGRSDGYRRRCFRRWFGAEAAEGPSGAPVPAPEPEAPEGWVDLCALDELQPGTIGEFFVDEVAIAVANVEGTLYALDNTCPHAGGPLGDGTLDGTTVACPWHGWTYDVCTGVCEVDPELSVATHRVRTRGGRIQLRLA